MKILVEMNLSPAWRETFEQEGIEAVHCFASALQGSAILLKDSVFDAFFDLLNCAASTDCIQNTVEDVINGL